jgi:hypothetical protein
LTGLVFSAATRTTSFWKTTASPTRVSLANANCAARHAVRQETRKRTARERKIIFQLPIDCPLFTGSRVPVMC